ncbi:signal peptidase I [Scytonema millei]|uniref:Signal peptidase I n=1 Tax=Scytonema millei VB511283 TaxID=1245923 RepID=A0A9X5E864_9CYAN|nr:signal peptidase I [Scytonema millei]NHC36558.1 signal peptidase I [Scytonema millei VB511283]
MVEIRNIFVKIITKFMPVQSFRVSKSQNPWAEGSRLLGITLLIGFGIRITAEQCYLIPSTSMKPTLQIDDRLFVDKISYHIGNPQRGDIIVFTPPEAVIQEEHSRDAYVKRVIGLPGEKVEVNNGIVYINDQPLIEHYIAEPPEYILAAAIVPPNSYLVLGDNRNRSYDSHAWGFISRDRIIGKAAVRFWPPYRVGSLYAETASSN